MSVDQTVRVIKGTGSELTLAQLERASAKLLVARIRGIEPQISFTFVQRLLDELIRRRHAEESEAQELSRISEEMDQEEVAIRSEDAEELRSDEIEVVDEVCAASGLGIPEDISLDELPMSIEEFEGLRVQATSDASSRKETDEAEDGGEEATDDEEEDDQPSPKDERPPRRRRPVLTCSKTRNNIFGGGLNGWRVLVISLLVAFGMVVVVFIG